MITLYTAPDCEDCRRLDRKLSDNHLAHRVQAVGEGGQETAEPHTLDDNGQLIHGHAEIDRRIDELWKYLQKARRYQSDLCHDYGEDRDDDLAGR